MVKIALGVGSGLVPSNYLVIVITLISSSMDMQNRTVKIKC